MAEPANPAETRWQLVLKHRRVLGAYVRSLVWNGAEAEDLFQELGLAVTRAASVPEDPATFVPFCRGVARNLAMHHARSRGRDRLVFDNELLDLVDQAFGEQDLESELWTGRRSALARCLEKLAPDDRSLLHSRFAEDETADEIGRRIQRSA